MRYTTTILLSFITLFSVAQKQRGIVIENNSENTFNLNKAYCLIIANNQYEDPNIVDLDGPVKDAEKLYKVLTSNYQFDSTNVTSIYNGTRKQILNSLKELSVRLPEEADLLIFFAGHGKYDEILKEGYWLPRDATLDFDGSWISNSQIITYLSAFKGRHLLMISDACFSGGILKTRSTSNESNGIERLYADRSRKGMTSGNLKTVPDESVFISNLLIALEKNNDKYISADQLFYKIRPIILENKKFNTEPLFGQLIANQDEGGEFVFMKKEHPSLLISSTAFVDSNKKFRSDSNINIVFVPLKKLSNDDTTYNKRGFGSALMDMCHTDLENQTNWTNQKNWTTYNFCDKFLEREQDSMFIKSLGEKIESYNGYCNNRESNFNAALAFLNKLDIDYAISGNYYIENGNLSITLKVYDCQSKKIIYSVVAEDEVRTFLTTKDKVVSALITIIKNSR